MCEHRRLLGVLALVLVLSGCSEDDAAVTIDQATSDYTALVDDVARALVTELGVGSPIPLDDVRDTVA